jgi:hypothetical protein
LESAPKSWGTIGALCSIGVAKNRSAALTRRCDFDASEETC